MLLDTGNGEVGVQWRYHEGLSVCTFSSLGIHKPLSEHSSLVLLDSNQP